MIKRPILAAALSFILFSIIIVYKFPNAVYPVETYSDGDNTTLICRIKEIEEKTNSFYIYAECDGYTLLLCARKSSIDISDIRIGNTIKALAAFTKWSEARNYGNFDEGKYYRSLGVCRKFYLNDYDIIEGSYSPLMELFRSIKAALKNSIETIADNETAGIFTAIVCGDKSELDSETKSLFQISGIAHILAVSGLHISFLGLGLFKILRKKIRLLPSSVISMLFVAAYSCMCGFTASSFRAVIMLAVRFCAVKTGKKYDMLSSMSLAAVLLLMENPFYITNSGFLLSFSALFGAAAVIPVISAFLQNLKVPSALISSFSISITTLPVIISLYYEFPLYGFLINIPVLWLLSYILSGAFIGTVCSFIWNAAGKFIMGFSIYLTDAVKLFCIFTLNLPFSRITTGYRNFFHITLYYIFLSVFLITANNINKKASNTPGKKADLKTAAKKIIFVLTAFAVMISLLLITPAAKKLKISFIDVDQGKCIVVQTPSGSAVMIDGGSTTVDDVYTYRVKNTLKYNGISRIEHVFVTHPDTDHISAIIDMVDSDDLAIGDVITADFGDNENYLQLLDSAEKNSIPIKIISEDLEITIDGATFKCLHCSQADEETPETDVNDMSSVIYLTYGNFNALFTGDISSDEERSMLDNGNVPENICLLDVAHHGSKYSSCEEFLEKASPEVSVISAGVDNIYGHPHAQTLERLKAINSEIYSTIDCGEIDISVGPDGIMEINTYLNILK